MKQVIIIGGGISGLVAGIYAQLNGFKSAIYEKHSIPGGLCSGWGRKGYWIDGSISYLVGVKENDGLNKVWQEVQGFQKKDIYFEESFVTIQDQGEQLVWYQDYQRLEAELKRVAPEDSQKIDELIQDLKLMDFMQIPIKNQWKI